ncbi:pilus assembly PilX N-terminal domain-containing protein [Cellvibrio sp. KY-YJ-3]|uniref:pilus assembly PilX N-terminal domain-containing protein n=1 Tax=Cellvibrio sp. KY-YJ-3 TaxID=454662 RepID=UPI001CDA16C6|nr:pilus assembly PilX N-terminal domain-containing protein [Cellvibrio sp. KY-YJ-3]
MFPKRQVAMNVNTQRGFLLPLALFIIVVMGVLALTISRTSTQSQTAVVQEFMSLQSFYAAESGAQRGMKAIFFDVNGRQAADAACANMNINPNYAGVDGLSSCTVTVTCSCRYQNGNNCAPGTAANYSATASADLLKSFYTINSLGRCGGHEYRAERRIQAGAFLEQEQ